MLALLLLTLTAAASSRDSDDECPWAGEDDVRARASLTSVTVNGDRFRVRGSRARDEFVDILESCGADRAVDAFDRWRAHRRAVNMGGVFIGTGLFVPFVGWGMSLGGLIVTPVMATNAGVRKREMIEEIEDARPEIADAHEDDDDDDGWERRRR